MSDTYDPYLDIAVEIRVRPVSDQYIFTYTESIYILSWVILCCGLAASGKHRASPGTVCQARCVERGERLHVRQVSET